MSGGRLPAVDHLAREVEGVIASSGRVVAPPVVIRAARRVLERARLSERTGATAGEAPGTDQLVEATLSELETVEPLRRVINATGVLLHTNLGRAPLASGYPVQADPRRGVQHPGPDGYTDLEFDLRTGRRGARFGGLEASICALTGAPAALVVNNNAAAVLLAVSTVAAGAEVVISRGELVEIGGSFRIPEVIAQGGAVLREVGTTNCTHVADYRGALGERTGAVLSVHRSNYRIEGFTAQVGHRELAEVAATESVPLLVDLGGGLVDERCGWLPGGPPGWLAGEPGVRQVLSAGADVVTFSGDKLLGGPQAGILVGRADLLDRMRRHPLARAVRFDGLRAGLLQGVVHAYLDRTAGEQVPLWRLASVPSGVLEARAEAIVGRVEQTGAAAGATVSARSMVGTVGAGAAPGSAVPGVGIEVASDTIAPDVAASRLRGFRTPVVAVVGDDRLRIHLQTVEPSDDAEVADALVDALTDGEVL